MQFRQSIKSRTRWHSGEGSFCKFLQFSTNFWPWENFQLFLPWLFRARLSFDTEHKCVLAEYFLVPKNPLFSIFSKFSNLFLKRGHNQNLTDSWSNPLWVVVESENGGETSQCVLRLAIWIGKSLKKRKIVPLVIVSINIGSAVDEPLFFRVKNLVFESKFLQK